MKTICRRAAADRCLLAREICDGHRAVGADGVVFYSPGRQAGIPLGDRAPEAAAAHFQVHNRDGGKAELSGNGMAGLAAVLFQRRLASSPLILQTAHRPAAGRTAGPPRPGIPAQGGDRPARFFQSRFFPFFKEQAGPLSTRRPGVLSGVGRQSPCRRPLPGTASPKQLTAWGEKLEGHPMFPGRVNVEFVDFSCVVLPCLFL